MTDYGSPAFTLYLDPAVTGRIEEGEAMNPGNIAGHGWSVDDCVTLTSLARTAGRTVAHDRVAEGTLALGPMLQARTGSRYPPRHLEIALPEKPRGGDVDLAALAYTTDALNSAELAVLCQQAKMQAIEASVAVQSGQQFAPVTIDGRHFEAAFRAIWQSQRPGGNRRLGHAAKTERSQQHGKWNSDAQKGRGDG